MPQFPHLKNMNEGNNSLYLIALLRILKELTLRTLPGLTEHSVNACHMKTYYSSLSLLRLCTHNSVCEINTTCFHLISICRVYLFHFLYSQSSILVLNVSLIESRVWYDFQVMFSISILSLVNHCYRWNLKSFF